MRRYYVILLLFSLVFTSLISPALGAPLFADVPENHWARDAVAELAAKGVIEGYPDGTFKGDRATSRWEMALMLQRMLAKMEMAHSQFATKADLEALRALTNQLKDELDSLGVRTTNLEDQYAQLDMRTTELERIRFYGYIQGNAISMGVTQNAADIGSAQNPGVDWSNGRLLVVGAAVTNFAKLGTVVKASKDSTFGFEIAAFSTVGDEIVASYWGISPPVLSNPFTGKGTLTPFNQGDNNIPWSKATLDRFWYHHSPTETVLTIGSYDNERIDSLVLKGQRNPCINPPETIPFYGINLKGNFTSNKDTNRWSYEAAYSGLPNASLYDTHLMNGSLIYRFDKGKVRAHYMYAKDSPYNDGTYIAPGGPNASVMPLYPLAPGNAIVYWRNRFGNITNPRLGTQKMGTFGLDLDYAINEQWSAFAKGAVSNYDPDTTNTMFLNTASGWAMIIGVKAKYEKIDGKLQYQYASNKYDPFMLQYPGIGSGIPVFLPYSSYYFNYYQLHDYLSYPSNRQGLKFEMGYNFTKKTRGEVNLGYLRQSEASTLANFTSVGNIEPLFPYLQTAGSNVKGHVFDWGVRLKHKFSDKWNGGIGYYNYLQRRNTFAIDDIDLKEDIAYLNLNFKPSNKWSFYGNFYYLNYRGHLGLANTGFKQYIPSVTAETKVAKNAKVGLTYRYYIYKDNFINNRNYNSNQLIMDWKLSF